GARQRRCGFRVAGGAASGVTGIASCVTPDLAYFPSRKTRLMAMRGRLGRYRLVRRLAVGGMAEVYLAVAEGLSGFEKRVVVKRLLPQHAKEGELLAMFLDEARLVATLRHPNIGEVYDVGAEGSDYF